jgi:branched-chain amino acid transport system substrate-binding protein
MRGFTAPKLNARLIVFFGLCLFFPSLAPAAPDAVVIGATVSKSGHFSTEVGPFTRLMEAWADLVNEEGGVSLSAYGKKLPIRFKVYDDKSDEATARKLYERLATVDKVHLLVGPYSSPLTMAVLGVAQRREIPFVAVCANSPKIYAQSSNWLVGVIDIGPRYTHRYWDMIKAEGRAKTVSFVVEDTLHPVGVAQGAKKLAEEAGLEVLSSDIFPPDAKDFTPSLAKLKTNDPDIVFVASNIPFAVNFMKQAREMKLNPREYHCIHHGGVFKEALGDGANHVVGQSYWVEGMNPSKSELVKAVLSKAQIAEPVYPWAPAYVAAFQIIRAALETAGDLDAHKLMDCLKRLKTETVLGEAKFHQSGYGSINTYPSQIQGGKYVVIWPPATASGRHEYPRAPW